MVARPTRVCRVPAVRNRREACISILTRLRKAGKETPGWCLLPQAGALLAWTVSPGQWTGPFSSFRQPRTGCTSPT